MNQGLREAVAAYGGSLKATLANPVVSGNPEDQVRAPMIQLVKDVALLCGLPEHAIALTGEVTQAALHTRPDFAVTRRKALIGFIELKAPGKGADPRKFRDPHDVEQWNKLQSLPNVMYSDGNAFSLWRSGVLVCPIVHLVGDVESSGTKLQAPPELLDLFHGFFDWEPIAPRTPKELAEVSARLCLWLRHAVTEQLSVGNPALTALAADWGKMLFPEATKEQFADGYAQTVTFGLLMARACDIELKGGLHEVAIRLGHTNTLMGAAIRVLTQDVADQATLKDSVEVLVRVLGAVDWSVISKGNPEAWLYFYEDFLEVYDNALRKQTGSYYTPPEVVGAMVGLVDETLRTRFGRSAGLAAPSVTLVDPAVGTGTFLLGVLRRIADTIREDEDAGAVPSQIADATKRLIAFEKQLGPFAVAQMRVLAELTHLLGAPPKKPVRMFVTDTLDNPYVEQDWLPAVMGAFAEARRDANLIKKDESITVVIGNPPYKDKAKGYGGWVEAGSLEPKREAPLRDWMPPAEWGVGAHAKHLRNLYIYFWRWATWKVFDHHPTDRGIVCFITAAGFLNGPGFQRMRDYLRRKADEIWIIDCSPEGHQPEVKTRIFEGVQQPICIVLASRSEKLDPEIPATVRFRALPVGHRKLKFEALKNLTLGSDGWQECFTGWRDPFLPAAGGLWPTFPALDELFVYNGSGVMPGRTWVIAPDADSLRRRWERLTTATTAAEMEVLFQAHAQGDRAVGKEVQETLSGHEKRTVPVVDDQGQCVPPAPYAFRSFDRQWIIPDNRLINRPNPTLWQWHSARQVYFTALMAHSPSSGPALTITGLIPDLHHYKGSFGGRAFPLWADQTATSANFPPGLLAELSERYSKPVSAEDLFSYVAGIAAHPAFTERFRADLVTPGLRIPLTADPDLFSAAADLGRMVIWLQTFGERFIDASAGRPPKAPRLASTVAPHYPREGAIPQDPAAMPDAIEYDPEKRRLGIGAGFIENVSPEVWNYEVSGKQVLRHWFSYRKANRERPVMGDRRPPSDLCNLIPSHWLTEYTTELLNLLHVLGRLVELEPAQADLLERICAGPLLATNELRSVGAFERPSEVGKRVKRSRKREGPGHESFVDVLDDSISK